MPGPVPAVPFPQELGRSIISHHTNENNISSDDALLRVTGRPPEMVTLQTCKAKVGGDMQGVL